ncbi:hypothetical protein ONE63_011506 [Megalurothrips usitatus]|uniref:Transposase domain-containing protein n=1 Tax=Megalurothrips usitatus TaxID=439358 RepID=A0AAV7WZ56_9NEOP|nr:hypothetical protein ONE63_011506 [Megalurothrips usitatus]
MFSGVRWSATMSSKCTLYRKARKATEKDLQDISDSLNSRPQHDKVIDEPLGDAAQNAVPEFMFPIENQIPLHINHDHCSVSIRPDGEEFLFEDFACSSRESNHSVESLRSDCLSFKSNASEAESSKAPKSLSSKLADWAIAGNITHKSVSSLLKILHDQHPELPVDARTLLGTVRDKAPVLSMGKGLFIYFGLRDCLLDFLNTLTSHPVVLVLTINIDGQSPCESSKKELWPILVKIDGFLHKPLIVCAYYGRGKPPCYEFLEMFVEEILDLINNGFHYNDHRVCIKLRAFICDFPALAHIKCTAHSNAFAGCTKCFVKGFMVHHTAVFHGLNHLLRTDENFRSMEHADHHKDESILLWLPIDMVKAFPLDPMHLIYIICVKRLCRVYKNGKNKFYVKQIKRKGKLVNVLKKKIRRGNKMSAGSVAAVDERIAAINKFMPTDEFGRILGPFSDFENWKATQCRQFIQAYSKPLEQLWKRLSERKRRSVPLSEVNISSTSITKAVKSKREDGPTCGKKGDHYYKLQYKGIRLSIKPNENVLCLQEDTIIKASNFVRCGSAWFVIGKMFANSCDFYPNSSKLFLFPTNIILFVSNYCTLQFPPNFAVVNFLDSDGKKTDEQEVVPISWIVKTKKGACCNWPKDDLITRTQLTTMVKTETPPNKTDFKMYPIRILHSGCTFTEATEKFGDLASKSTAEENDGGDDGDRETDSDKDDSPRRKKRILDQQEPTNLRLGSLMRDPASSLIQNLPPSLFDNVATSEGQSHEQASFQHRFQGSKGKSGDSASSSSFVTKAEFKIFERRVFNKLNLIYHTHEEGLTYLKSQKGQGRSLISLPAIIESRCSLPANDIKNLEAIEDALDTSETKTELATYLSQLGGKTHRFLIKGAAQTSNRQLVLLYKLVGICGHSWNSGP